MRSGVDPAPPAITSLSFPLSAARIADAGVLSPPPFRHHRGEQPSKEQEHHGNRGTEGAGSEPIGIIEARRRADIICIEMSTSKAAVAKGFPLLERVIIVMITVMVMVMSVAHACPLNGRGARRCKGQEGGKAGPADTSKEGGCAVPHEAVLILGGFGGARVHRLLAFCVAVGAGACA